MGGLDLFDEYGAGSELNRLPLHHNPGLEIVYLERGHLTWQCDGRHETVSAESIYFTLPWNLHGSVFEMEPGHKWHFIVLNLDENSSGHATLPSALGFDAQTAEGVMQALMNATHHAWPASELLALLLPELVRELSCPGSMHWQRVIHLTAAAVLELSRTVSMEEHESTRRRLHMPHQMSRLLTILNAEYSRNWTLDEMASVAGLKKSQFISVFRKNTGDTPVAYLARIRISKAMAMLKSTDATITSIAFSCGFNSSQYFANVFRKITGTTPVRYRKEGLPELTLPRSIQPGSWPE